MEPNLEPFDLAGWLDDLRRDCDKEGDFAAKVTAILSFMNDATECYQETKWKAQEQRIVAFLLTATSSLTCLLTDRLVELTPNVKGN